MKTLEDGIFKLYFDRPSHFERGCRNGRGSTGSRIRCIPIGRSIFSTGSCCRRHHWRNQFQFVLWLSYHSFICTPEIYLLGAVYVSGSFYLGVIYSILHTDNNIKKILKYIKIWVCHNSRLKQASFFMIYIIILLYINLIYLWPMHQRRK